MIEMIKRVVADMLNLQAKTQYGTITAYNPNDYTVKVMLQPEGVETGWIPLASSWTGKNMGAVFGPMIGTDCRVDYVGGVAEAAMAGGRFFNANFLPPIVQSGQGAIVDGAGSFVKLNNDGTITLSANASITTTTPILTQNGNMTVTGNIIADGNVTGAIVTGNTDVVIAGLSGKNHYHPGVATGTGNTGAMLG